MFEVLYGWDNAKISNRTGLFPGLEMRAAYEEAEKYGGRVVLGDCPIQLKSNGLFDRRVQFISKEFPTVTEILMDERDQYMSSKLLKIASESRSVVAVVGRGHLEGIKKYWKQPVAKDLMKVPYSKPGPAIILWKTLKYSLVLFLLRMTHHVTKNWSRRKLAGH
ncbi:uncharacterized protein LOC130743016 isoform X2 [Lotus japonicus]|uniref:uncharacterized protein LOC130743016 isoform X2 n=1 Tax=Lotus japonicus TaxID=34305 RepID=UPI0025900E91|nr:uncharacterized protein LOC130743016 isoform X2 [Lotus japonicus]